MTLGYTDGKTKIKIFLLIFGLLSISSLTIFELRKVISGPDMTINCGNDEDCNDVKTDKNIYKISGQTKNVYSLIIGDRNIYMDTKGYFEQNILLYPGQNLITIKSVDKFGKEVKKDISIYYTDSNNKLSLAK